MENKPDLSRKFNFIRCRYFLMRDFVGTSRETGKSSGRRKHLRWVLTAFFLTILTSACVTLLSSLIFETAGLVVAFLVLFFIVFLGIVFDMVGVAVTAADETPFHAMASHRVPQARQAISLLRNADRVSSICNDVIGDICGVVSGSAAAVISTNVAVMTGFSHVTILSVALSALVAGLTVGGKAAGKSVAINNATKIVSLTAQILYAVHTFPQRLFQRKNH